MLKIYIQKALAGSLELHPLVLAPNFTILGWFQFESLYEDMNIGSLNPFLTFDFQLDTSLRKTATTSLGTKK